MLVAHLICKSLGYFTPASAAQAVLSVANGTAYWCEWYCDWADKKMVRESIERSSRPAVEATIRDVGKIALQQAIKQRHHHHGPMADIDHAKAVIKAELAGKGPEFASWF